MRNITFALFGLLILSGLPTHGQLHESPELLKIFIDCDECDFNHMREEIQFLDYVRDKELAQVHVFVSELSNGSGGSSYTFTFSGMNEYRGKQDTLYYSSRPTQTHAERRKEMQQTIVMGLMPYIARTDYAGLIDVRMKQSDRLKRSLQEAPERDRWNYWVFELEAGGELEKETLESEYSLESGFEARRITDEWKTEADFSQRYRKRTIRPDETSIDVIYRDISLDYNLVKSLGQHWSAGLSGDLESSTYKNIRLLLGVSAAVEYNVFPYREASRRELTLAYHIGMDHQSYFAETIYMKNGEYLPVHDLQVNLRFNQPWGYARTVISLSQYLHKPDKNYVGIYGRLNWRVFKGLSLYMEGSYGIVRNQLYLPREEATLEEILLRQKRIATEYEFEFDVGLSFTFGSIYNNVVNTRL